MKTRLNGSRGVSIKRGFPGVTIKVDAPSITLKSIDVAPRNLIANLALTAPFQIELTEALVIPVIRKTRMRLPMQLFKTRSSLA